MATRGLTREGKAPTLDELLALRERHVRLLHETYKYLNTWSIGVGRLRVRASIGTNLIAIVFILWHALTGTSGILFILLWQDGRELGVALLVGALFGFGSFLAQFWSQAMDNQREFVGKVWHEDDVRLLRETLESVDELDHRIGLRLKTARGHEPA